MGNGGSKPEQQVFSASPNTPQTDSTRAHDSELKVQARVREELTRIRDQQAAQFTQITDSLTISPPQPKTLSKSGSSKTPATGLAASLSSPFYQDHSPRSPDNPNNPAPSKPDSGRSSDSVKKEVMDLRKKLEGRKKVEQMPKEVEAAKEKVVQCLRTNDRRPLDCWREVEEFKRAVGKLEGAFVQRVGR
ncbi:hypothetical protein LTR53_008704 [Teratosphaeriaceae sp. CCFEE 6253]|nr:hypothetical protein LTR53_008704 [Teratosphaeriaceae sp. CCFEE 6253]